MHARNGMLHSPQPNWGAATSVVGLIFFTQCHQTWHQRGTSTVHEGQAALAHPMLAQYSCRHHDAKDRLVGRDGKHGSRDATPFVLYAIIHPWGTSSWHLCCSTKLYQQGTKQHPVTGPGARISRQTETTPMPIMRQASATTHTHTLTRKTILGLLELPQQQHKSCICDSR